MVEGGGTSVICNTGGFGERNINRTKPATSPIDWRKGGSHHRPLLRQGGKNKTKGGSVVKKGTERDGEKGTVS